MSRTLIFFVVGLAVGAGGMYLLVADRDGDRPDRAEEIRELRHEKSDLLAELEKTQMQLVETRQSLQASEGRVAALQNEPAAAAAAEPLEPTAAEPAPAVPAGPVSEEELENGVKAFAPFLRNVILGQGAEEAVAKLRALFERAGPEEIQSLIEKFKGDELTDDEKTVLAHALAQSGDPAALRALQEVLRDPESGMMLRRLASHGLAFTDEPSVVESLRLAAKEDEDPGARANAAFGLARRGDAEGLALYAKATDEAFERKDPMAIAYFQGLALLGEKALPALRTRLTTYSDPQMKLTIISLLRQHKDAKSIPALRALSADPTTNADVRKAAEQALSDLAK